MTFYINPENADLVLNTAEQRTLTLFQINRFGALRLSGYSD